MACDKLPPDVSRYIERRQSCNHWRSEIGYDDLRAADIESSVCATCPRSDADLAKLKRRYASNAVILRSLAESEPQIEPATRKERSAICTRIKKLATKHN
jgi:hypothetical protein